VYTIEILYRVGARHNDIHLGNVMMVREPHVENKIMRFLYLTRHQNGKGSERQRREYQYDVPLYLWQPRIYDFDRVFKHNWTSRMNDVKEEFATSISPSAVVDRFPWHDPKIDTAELNVTKVLQHIRNAAQRYGNTNLQLAMRNISLGESILKGLVQKYNLNRRTWSDYYIPVKRDREQDISSEVRSPEMIILSNLGPEFAMNQSNRPEFIANMRNLYR
jgi:hypothetical protein